MKSIAFRERRTIARILREFSNLTKLSIKDFKKIIAVLGIIAELFGVLFFANANTPRGQAMDLTGYKLVFSDEFNGNDLNLDVWEHRAEGARRSGFNDRSQVSLKDGNLVIKAEYLENGTYGKGWYAGMIRTKQEFVKGYYEIRCICSKGGGFWSAFWLNSKNMSSAEASNGGIGGAEIDIFEAFNYGAKKKENSVSLNVHVGGYGDGLQSQNVGDYLGNNIYTEYNTYGLEWTDSEYIFYINGVECDRTSFKDGVSKTPEYPIVSLELPDEFSEAPGFSTEFIVDYVRIYQK